VVFETEYQTILNAATTDGVGLPKYTEQIRQNNLVKDLKNAGLWSKLGSFYMFRLDASGGGDNAFSLYDWIEPNDELAEAQLISFPGYAITPEFINDYGWRMRIGTGIKLESPTFAINPITISSSGNSVGSYVVEYISGATTDNASIWSSLSNTFNAARYFDTTNHKIFRDKTLTTSYDFTGEGFKATTIDGRPDTDTTIIFRNNGVSTSRTKTGIDIGIAPQLQLNGQKALNNFDWVVGMCYSGGGGLYSTDVEVLDTIITNYMTS